MSELKTANLIVSAIALAGLIVTFILATLIGTKPWLALCFLLGIGFSGLLVCGLIGYGGTSLELWVAKKLREKQQP